MIIDYIKNLLIGIFIVIVLLVCCMAIDSADEISNINESSLPQNVPKGTVITNNSSIVAVNESASVIVVKHNDVIHRVKPKYPTISMWAKPSCGCCNSYRWHYRTFVNYCPHNTGKVCMKLKKYLYDICFERDCPLPTLSDVEQFTRYITKDKKLRCHGNCKNWRRWHYNKHLKTDEGVCCANPGMCIVMGNNEACEEFDEI